MDFISLLRDFSWLQTVTQAVQEAVICDPSLDRPISLNMDDYTVKVQEAHLKVFAQKLAELQSAVDVALTRHR